MGLRIKLIGRPAIFDKEGDRHTIRGHQSWAVLARVLLSKQEISRQSLAQELFPDALDPLGSLRWCLASLRKALGSADMLAGDPLQTNLPEDVRIDVAELESGAFDPAFGAALLEGVEPRCGPEFSTWLLIERERVAGMIDSAIRTNILRALSATDWERAIELAELGARRQPFDEAAHILLVKSLALAGRKTAADNHIEATKRAFEAELGVSPTSALNQAAHVIVPSADPDVGVPALAKSRLEAGRATIAAGSVDVGLDLLRQALADAEQSGDPSLHGSVLQELGSALVHAVRGHDDEGAILLSQAVSIAEQADDMVAAASGLRELGYIESFAGRRPAAGSYLSRALDLTDDPDTRAGVHAVIGFNLVDWGKVEEGMEHYARSLKYADAAGNRRRRAWSLGVGAWGHMLQERWTEAETWLQECLDLIEDLQWDSFRPWPVALLAEVRLLKGQSPETVLDEIEEAFALACQLGDPCWEGITARVMASAYAAGDNQVKALEWIDQAYERCRRETDIYAALLAAIIFKRAQLNLAAGHTENAEADGRELLTISARTHTDHYIEFATKLISGLAVH